MPLPSTDSRIRRRHAADGFPLTLDALPQASTFIGLGAGMRVGSCSNPSTPLPLTPLPYELAFFKPPPPLLSATLRSASYASIDTRSGDPKTPDTSDLLHTTDPFSAIKFGSSSSDSSSLVDANFTFGRAFGSTEKGISIGGKGKGKLGGRKRPRCQVDDGEGFPTSIGTGFTGLQPGFGSNRITGLGGGLGRARSRDGRSRASGTNSSGSGSGSVGGGREEEDDSSWRGGSNGGGRAMSFGWDDSEMGSSRGGSEEREVEMEWTEWEDGILQSILAHPIRPLSHPFPPGTLPEPTALDELTNQVFALQARSSQRRVQSKRSSLRDVIRGETESDADADVQGRRTMTGTIPPDLGVEGWQHDWTQTRRRLFQIARLESKGLDSSPLGPSPVSASKRRAGGILSRRDTTNADRSSVGTSIEVYTTRLGTQQDSLREGMPQPITTSLRARLNRPHIKRVSSMDFLDGPAFALGDGNGQAEDGVEMQVDLIEGGDELGESAKEAGLGRVLRLSSTLQTTSQIGSSNAAQPDAGPAPLSLGLGATSLDYPVIALASRPAGPKRMPSWNNPVRPTSLLQRGRSFTAEDLMDAEDDLVQSPRRSGYPSARTGQDGIDDSNATRTPTKAKCFQAMLASPRSSPSAPLSSPGATTDSSISPPETLIGSPSATSTNPFAAMLVIPPTPETPKARKTTVPLFGPAVASAALSMNLGLGLRSPPSRTGGGLTRSHSSCTVDELSHRPHAQQLGFIQPVKPTQTQPCELLAPFPFAFEELGKKVKAIPPPAAISALVENIEDRQRAGAGRKLRRLASGIRLDSGRR